MSEDSSERPAFNSVDAYYAVARTLQTKKEYKRALFYLGLALKQDDKHVPSYLLRSRCYMYLCETDKALEDVKTVLQYEPKNPNALLLLGEIYYLRGDFEEALTTFHQGRSLRPTIDAFLVGVHKSETAIQNSCNDCKIQLSPELDLTDFYYRAFPPKRQPRMCKRLVLRGSKSETSDDVAEWPHTRPKDIQMKLIKQSYSDFTYLDDIYTAEGRRTKRFKKGRSDFFPDLATVLNRSKENRQAAVGCAIYLDRHADLFQKLDPGLRNTTDSL
ncbi:unnamed protein product [Calicophoron daubneyi]|uniref:Outer dynein arm-docking complex subunit 4 n=1 Tax=Calicophoron daubneyi TaxID=300641 RepID=A0AAV2TNT4_CALDB